MPKQPVEYGPLLSADDFDDATEALACKDNKYLPSRRILAFIVAFETMIIIYTMCSLFSIRMKNATTWPEYLYSPAQDVIEYEVRAFNVGFENDTTIYQGKPSPEVDKAWNDLYNFGISRIPKSQAALLANKTSAIPDDEGYYIVELDVFHQLHCLNMIRQALDPEHYPDMRLAGSPESADNFEHVSHCIDSIRQSLMCSGDVSTIVWQWSETYNSVMVKGNVAHTCRKFENIQKWGMENMMKTKHDVTKHIEDGIVIPVIYN